jgi:hypothetical protein
VPAQQVCAENEGRRPIAGKIAGRCLQLPHGYGYMEVERMPLAP